MRKPPFFIGCVVQRGAFVISITYVYVELQKVTQSLLIFSMN